MSVLSYPDALKAFRRGAHVNQKLQRGLVLCRNAAQLSVAWDEAIYTMRQSGVGLKQINYATRTLFTDKDAILRFGVLKDENEAKFNYGGSVYTHVIFLFDPTVAEQGFMGTILRLPDNYKGETRMDIAEL